MQNTARSERLVYSAMLSAISLVLVLIVKIPFPPAPFLVYDPADVPIFISTFAFGPLAGLGITFVVSFVQAFMLGGDGIIGFFMHMVSTGAFVLVAGLMYKANKSRGRAVAALTAGTAVMTLTMLGWNAIITPVFLGVELEEVMKMLVPIILPFNLLKAGINSVITFFVYKRVSEFLHHR